MTILVIRIRSAARGKEGRDDLGAEHQLHPRLCWVVSCLLRPNPLSQRTEAIIVDQPRSAGRGRQRGSKEHCLGQGSRHRLVTL
eukprot:5177889-Pyramimonas_sp.AAC.1